MLTSIGLPYRRQHRLSRCAAGYLTSAGRGSYADSIARMQEVRSRSGAWPQGPSRLVEVNQGPPGYEF
jgi:hypothetical protein